MSDDFKSLEVKIDMALMLLEQMRLDRKECRSHCDTTVLDVWGQIREIRKGNPQKWYAVAMVALAIMTLISLVYNIHGGYAGGVGH